VEEEKEQQEEQQQEKEKEQQEQEQQQEQKQQHRRVSFSPYTSLFVLHHSPTHNGEPSSLW